MYRSLMLVLAGFPLLAFAASAPEISLQVGSKKYQASGEGECRAAPMAAIYGVASSLHSVSHRSGNRSLSFSLWQPKNGSGDMLQLQVSDGAVRHEVNTVKGGSKRDTQGSGKATLARAGAGATFTIDAVTAKGEKITGRIQCSRFAAIQAEGG